MEDHSKTWYSSRVFVVALIAVVLLAAIIYAISSRGSDKSAVATTPTGQVAAPVVAPAPPPILTKDPEFIKLIHPAQSDDDLLAQSAEFAQKKQEIEAQLAAIHDSDLRTQASEEAWSKVDKAAYIEREKKTIADSFPAAIQQILSRHHADWFEVGHVSFPGTSSFAVTSVEASPVTVLDDTTVPINVAMLDGVYSKFDSITGPQIEQNVASQVQAKSCDQQLKNVCQNLGGSSSQCSDPAELENVRSQLQFSCDAGPSADELRQKAKQETRASRLVLVGQGDLPSHRIDKLMLVDYDTEAILLELPADSLAGKIHWKPPVQSRWTTASSDEADTNEDASGDVTTKEVEVVGQIFDVQTADRRPCATSEVCWWNVVVEEGGNQEWGLFTTNKPPLEKGQYIRAVAKVTSREEKFMTKAEIEAHLPGLVSYRVVSPETDADAAAAAKRIKADNDAFADMKSK
jgi:hypothetical protein